MQVPETITAPPLAPEAMTVMSVLHLRKYFGSHHVLEDLTFTLHKGENIVVLGRSGSGKSVLIKCIIGLLEPDEGSITVLDNDINALNHEELDKIRAKIGFLFQSNALYDSLTVRENLEFPLRRHWIEVTKDKVEMMVHNALKDVGLEHTIDMMPVELSGGMRKRIALARTLILQPEIILYDEPTTGLDPITGREIVHLIMDIQRKYNTSSVVISHDMTCVRLVADRVIVLVDGRCYAEGRYAELAKSNDPVLRQFFE